VSDVSDFYGTTFGYEVEAVGDERRCSASQRSIWFRPGAANQLLEAHYRFDDLGAYKAFLRRLALQHRLDEPDASRRHVSQRVHQGEPTEREPDEFEVALCDPDGSLLHFRFGKAGVIDNTSSLPCARLQHYAVRSPYPQVLVDFYSKQLGFTVSDCVHDAEGNLSAAFLRTDAEHHALAIFRSAESRFDHFSCEAEGWNELRAWADRMADVRVPMAWGVGRHGPGNDNFFMVSDPDGNLAEISCDLEVCAEDRPTGLWPHEPHTLNLWGSAIMRR
jgi:hypothetical protein